MRRARVRWRYPRRSSERYIRSLEQLIVHTVTDYLDPLVANLAPGESLPLNFSALTPEEHLAVLLTQQQKLAKLIRFHHYLSMKKNFPDEATFAVAWKLKKRTAPPNRKWLYENSETATEVGGGLPIGHDHDSGSPIPTSDSTSMA